MLVVVIDTNVLASGVLQHSSPPAGVIDAWLRGEIDIVVSDHLLSELRRTLDKPYFRRMTSPQRVEQVLQNIALQATLVTPAPLRHSRATHPEDDLILATAVAGRAQFLVTGDRQLLALGQYREVRIVTAGEFLAVLATGETGQPAPHS